MRCFPSRIAEMCTGRPVIDDVILNFDDKFRAWLLELGHDRPTNMVLEPSNEPSNMEASIKGENDELEHGHDWHALGLHLKK